MQLFTQVMFIVTWFRAMVFNATFKNNSAIAWQLDLLWEETGVRG